MIQVKLFAYFRENRGKEVFVEYQDNLKVEDVVKQLEINIDEVSIILINGRHKNLDSILEDENKLFLFPPVGGG